VDRFMDGRLFRRIDDGGIEPIKDWVQIIDENFQFSLSLNRVRV
jgi:hypothetical protein